jgi:hypothetical protein
LHHFGDHRVHLSRHDRTTRLKRGQRDLRQASVRARAQQPEVAGDLVERKGDDLQDCTRLDQYILARLRLEMISGLAEGTSGPLRQAFRDTGAEALRCIQTGTDGGSAEGKLAEAGEERRDALCRQLDASRPPSDLLPERDRHRIHQMGPGHLDRVPMSIGELDQRQPERSQRW